MRLAFVLTNLSGGGAEKAILKTIDLLSNVGHQCTLFLLESKFAYQVPPELSLCILSDKETTSKSWFSKRVLAFRLNRKLNFLKPDIVISTLPFADEVTALSKPKNHWCRIANTLSVEIASLAKSKPSKAQRRMLRYQNIYGTRNLIAVSQGVADDLRQQLHIHSRVEVIPNPFNKADILDKASKGTDIDIGAPYMLYVGRFAPQKRQDLLLDAFQKVPERFHLVMLTPPDAELTRMIDLRSLSNRVHVIGFQDNPYAWMAQAELLVLTSDREGLPNVLIESLLCGTPVVSTDCPSGPREILLDIAPESLVPCGDLQLLSEAINLQLSRNKKPLHVELSKYDQTNTLLAYERLVTPLER